ncbi:GNAT family N-acetyltransferase [Uliginosibacterium paludis]|uniref:GNAT family N-acetyltransferase n=1 Tax=Uliginosibacterium paludis TaxID=1615952 RepID=A0ABV2CLG2_9RHOO
MNIRPAVPADAEAIGHIRVNAWRAAYGGHMPTEYLASLDPQANLAGLREALASPKPPFVLAVAECDQKLVGFSISGSPRYEAARDTLELWALNVDPRYWRKGVGKRLVQEMLHSASAAKASCVELWCLHGNLAAMALYESCGFVRTGAERTTTALTGMPLNEVAYAQALSPIHRAE